MPVFAGAEADSAMEAGGFHRTHTVTTTRSSRFFVTRTIVGGLAGWRQGSGLTAVCVKEARGRDFLPNALHRGLLGGRPAHRIIFLRLEPIYSTVLSSCMLLRGMAAWDG